MAYKQPTYSSLQKMKETSLQARSACDLSVRAPSHLPDAEGQRGLVDPDGKRTAFEESSANLQGRFHQPDLQFLVDFEGIPASSSKSSSIRTDASLMYNAPPQPVKRPRYYSHTLSNADKHALTLGDTKHNSPIGSPQDLIHRHGPRRELIPRTIHKANKTAVPTGLQHDKQRRQHIATPTVSKNGYPVSTSPLRITSSLADLHAQPAIPPAHRQPQPYDRHANHSLIDLRFPGRTAAPSPSPNIRIRIPTSTPLSPSPSPSPSTPIPSRFQPNPTTTFDAFLAPHKSGKGETYAGSPNAKSTHGALLSSSTSSLSSSPPPPSPACPASPAAVVAGISRRRRLAGKLRFGARKRGGAGAGIVEGEAEAEAEAQGGVVRRFSWE